MAKNMEEALSKKIRDMDRTATEKFESFMRGKNTDYMEGYDAGKSDQRKIDIDKACIVYCKTCDTKECEEFGGEMCDWVTNFRKKLEEEQ